jgi:uncharacterized protein YpmB
MFKQKLYAGLIGAMLMLGLTLSTPTMASSDVTEAEVPAPVMKAFKQIYPDAVKVEWKLKKVHFGKLKGTPVYEVEFEDKDGIDHEMKYSPEGKLYKSTIK